MAPSLILVAVRASAPVCGNPFNIGMIMLTRPCPHNSLSGLKGCPLFPARRSAMREHNRLSIAATKMMAITKYARSRATEALIEIDEGQAKTQKSVGMLPYLSLTRVSPLSFQTVAETTVAIPMAISGAGR